MTSPATGSGESIDKLAERIRILGQRIAGCRVETDGRAIGSTYDWGYRIGRNQAIRTLVGDQAAQGHRSGRRWMTTTAAQTVQHEPWCNDHVLLAVDPAAFIEENSWCRGVLWRGDPDGNGTNVPKVTIEDQGAHDGVVLEV